MNGSNDHDPNFSPKASPDEAAEAVKSAALSAGFGLVGIASATRPDTLDLFHDWLDAGYAGEMAYIERRRDAYADLNKVLPSVRSVVLVALDYANEKPAVPTKGFGKISRYAWGSTDYHTVIRKKLGRVAEAVHQAVPECRTRAVVDTAPLLERDFARRAGLGWFGKNTMIISKHRGSFFFLGALLTDAELTPDEPHETSHCGTCTACLDACPTNAFVAPHVLDATRCISYLTIELRDADLPEEFQTSLNDWVFGCDICQDVCPWNSKAVRSEEAAFAPLDCSSGKSDELAGESSGANPGAGAISLDEILSMTEAEFLNRFGGTPLERTGLQALQRNARAVAKQQESD